MNELRQVYIVNGDRYYSLLDATTVIERESGFAYVFPEWLDVTTFQDLVEGQQLWLCGYVWARNEMFGKWHVLTD